jgi:hypothetical protein
VPGINKKHLGLIAMKLYKYPTLQLAIFWNSTIHMGSGCSRKIQEKYNYEILQDKSKGAQ